VHCSFARVANTVNLMKPIKIVLSILFILTGGWLALMSFAFGAVSWSGAVVTLLTGLGWFANGIYLLGRGKARLSKADLVLTLMSCLIMAAIVVPNFIRARNTSAQNACINNLRQIDGAKQQWALEQRKLDTDVPTATDIAPYIKGNHVPTCPNGGVYTVGAVNTDPTCSIGTGSHVLPTP
jgi:hypothetical protein